MEDYPIETNLTTASSPSSAALAAKLAVLRYSVMAPHLAQHLRPDADGAADGRNAAEPELRTVVLSADVTEIRAEADAERFVVPASWRGDGPVAIHDFDLGADILRFAGRAPEEATLDWIDAGADGRANDLQVTFGRRSVVLVDVGGDGDDGGAPAPLPAIEEIFYL